MNPASWDRRIVAIIVILLVLYGWDWISMPFEDQVRALVEALIPWSPLFVILYFVGEAALKGITDGIKNFLKSIWRAVLGLFWVLSFAAFFFPLAVADTFLFGSLSHWLWINQSGAMILLALTAFAFYFMGGIAANFWRRYFGFMVMWGVLVLVVSVLEHYFMDSSRVVFRVHDEKIYAVPTQTVHVEKSAEPFRIYISAFGRVKAGDRYYPPMGDPTDTVPDPLGGWYAPRGQIRLVIYPSRTAMPILIPIKHQQEGVQKLAGVDTGEYAGGYYFSGVAEIPAGVSGWIMLDFESIKPKSGFVRTTIRVAPERSLPGRLWALEWYSFFLLFVFGSVLWWSVPPLVSYFLSTTETTATGNITKNLPLGWLKFIWFVTYVATVVALLFTTPIGNKAYGWAAEKFDKLLESQRKTRSTTVSNAGAVTPAPWNPAAGRRQEASTEVINPIGSDVIRDKMDKEWFTHLKVVVRSTDGKIVITPFMLLPECLPRAQFWYDVLPRNKETMLRVKDEKSGQLWEVNTGDYKSGPLPIFLRGNLLVQIETKKEVVLVLNCFT